LTNLVVQVLIVVHISYSLSGKGEAETNPC